MERGDTGNRGCKVTECFFCFGLCWQDQNSEISDPENQGKEMVEGRFPLVRKDWIRGNLGKHDIHKFTGLHSQHPQVLSIHVLTMIKLLMTISERSWPSGEIPEGCKKANPIPVFKRARKAQRTTGQSAPPQSLEGWWSVLLWRPSHPCRWQEGEQEWSAWTHWRQIMLN